MKQEKLICPFCGNEVEIRVCDSEGNDRTDEQEYINEPYSGIGYYLSHSFISEEFVCPIQTHEEEFLGCHIYDSIEEIYEKWNKRAV